MLTEDLRAANEAFQKLAWTFQQDPNPNLLIDAMAMLPVFVETSLESVNTYFWRIHVAASYLGQSRDAAWRKRFRDLAADTHYQIVDKVSAMVGKPNVRLDLSSNLVVIIMHQVLTYPHAPTIYADQLGRHIADKEGFRYILLNANQVPLNDRLAGFGGVTYNKLDTVGMVRGRLNVFESQDTRVTEIFTPPTDTMSVQKLREIFTFLEALKPRALVGYAGSNLAADILAKHVPVICHPSVLTPVATRGAAIVDYCANYGGHGVAGAPGVTAPANIRFRPKMDLMVEGKPGFDWARMDAPTDARIVILPGNRLDTEVSSDFEAGLVRLLEAAPDLFLVFIGGDAAYQAKTPALQALSARWRASSYLPMEEYLSAIASADAMIDTPASGNTTGAQAALIAGKPVFCLSDTDNGYLFAVDDLPGDAQAVIDAAIAYFTDDAARTAWDKRAAWWGRVRKPELLGVGMVRPFQDVIDAADETFAQT